MSTPEKDRAIADLRQRIADATAVQASLETWSRENVDKLVTMGAELDALLAEPTPTPVPVTPAEFYGPVGEWPVELAWAHDDTIVTKVTCSASWAEIAAVEQRFGNVPLIIAVRPGKLDGFGAGSTKKPVLAGIRRPDSAPLLIMAAEGFGTVTTANSWRLDKLRKVGFAHFDLWPFGYVATDCENLTFARSTVKPANISTQVLSSGITMHELVRLEPVNEDSDAWGWRNADDKPNAVTEKLIVRGCLALGAYKSANSAAHCDTIQISGAGKFREIVLDRSLVVASSNHGLILTPTTDNVLIRDTAIIGGEPRKERFPDAADRYQGGGGIAINGKPTNIRAERAVITGKVVPSVPGISESTPALTPEWWAAHAPLPMRTVTETRAKLAKLWAQNSPLG